jgi:hypothetical protein
MASNKLSALSAVSGSLTSDSLVYIADTQDSGSSYASKKITVANLLSDVASTTDLGTFSGTTIDNNVSPSKLLSKHLRLHLKLNPQLVLCNQRTG